MVQYSLMRWAIGWQMTEEEFGLRLTSHKYPRQLVRNLESTVTVRLATCMREAMHDIVFRRDDLMPSFCKGTSIPQASHNVYGETDSITICSGTVQSRH
jgi:hypothetical protein